MERNHESKVEAWVEERLTALAPKVRRQAWVTLTGGDPVLWDLTGVVHGLRLGGFRIAVETQAALWADWLELPDLA